MFCPRCRVEYRSGFTTCSTCGVSLVQDLPRGEPPFSSAETVTVFGAATESEVAVVQSLLSALLLLGALALAWLFFLKKRAFPLAATVFGVVYLVADLADSVLWLVAVRPRSVDAGALVETFAENVPTGAVILAVVVYLRTSERVRATFVE